MIHWICFEAETDEKINLVFVESKKKIWLLSPYFQKRVVYQKFDKTMRFLHFEKNVVLKFEFDKNVLRDLIRNCSMSKLFSASPKKCWSPRILFHQIKGKFLLWTAVYFHHHFLMPPLAPWPLSADFNSKTMTTKDTINKFPENESEVFTRKYPPPLRAIFSI